LPGATYILGIQNTNSTNVSFTLQVNFDVTAPTLVVNVPGLHLGLNGPGVLNSDAFLTKLSFDSLGISNIQSVLFGGTGTDIGWDIAVETNSGNVYVIGSTTSKNFPTTNTVGVLTSTNTGQSDVFITVVSNDMSGLAYSTYLGGRKNDYGYGLVVGPGGDAYIVGRTLSTNFPVVNPFMVPTQRNNNAFVAKIQFTNPLVSVTLQTAPVNLQVLVDGVTNLAPVTFSNWTAGSTHTISTISVQDTTNGATYVWTNWSDGGTLTHTVVPLTNYTITARFGLLPTSTVAVVVDGKGSVSPNLSRNTLQAGQTYSVTANPGSGYIFLGWTMISGTNAPAFVTNSTNLKFVWQPGLVLQASFIPNPFIPVKGNYAGLFYQTNEVLFDSSGYFTENLASQGTFSGKIQLAGKSYSFSGKFTTNGTFSTSIPRTGAEPISMSLQLNFDNSLSGELSNSQWVAELLANRKIFASTNPAPQSAYRYTLTIPGSDDSTSTPGGYAYGTVTVNSSGALQFSETLGDGTKVSQGSFVSEDGVWPLFATPYSRKGSILGWITFTNEPGDDLSGLVHWFKPSQTNTKLYPGGFTVETNAFGSIYSFVRGVPVLNFNPVIVENGIFVQNLGPSPGQVVLQAGGLTRSITNNIVLGDNNIVTNKGPNKLSMSISTGNGLFHGNIVDPASGKSIPFNGAVLQKTNLGFGTFLGTPLGSTQSGRVLITPRP
jgi:hypothetical protein